MYYNNTNLLLLKLKLWDVNLNKSPVRIDTYNIATSKSMLQDASSPELTGSWKVPNTLGYWDRGT